MRAPALPQRCAQEPRLKPRDYAPRRLTRAWFEGRTRVRRDAAIWLQSELAPVVLPMLEAWRSIRIRAAELGRQLSQMHVKAKHAAYSCRSPESAP